MASEKSWTTATARQGGRSQAAFPGVFHHPCIQVGVGLLVLQSLPFQHSPVLLDNTVTNNIEEGLVWASTLTPPGKLARAPV